ncbi:MAG: type II toxin-antitoxin system VapC family toxin [Deltaproteobacteria bacterium]|nr:type II toxin-antitoxin system VapC family toxin [Deltaproteobacteria bacterium]
MAKGIKIKYLDTSVIIKLYLDEDGSSHFKDYFNTHTNFSTTLMTFYESMSVLKSRLFKNESKDQYYEAVTDLAIHGWGGKIEIEPIDLNSMQTFKEVNKLSVENNLDIADAIQIYAILNGKYSHFILESASVLITSDDNQEQAAKKYGIRVWNCRKEPKPKWLDN